MTSEERNAIRLEIDRARRERLRIDAWETRGGEISTSLALDHQPYVWPPACPVKVDEQPTTRVWDDDPGIHLHASKWWQQWMKESHAWDF